MISAISLSPEVELSTNTPVHQPKSKTYSSTYANTDTYTSSNPKENLKKALKSGDIVYTKPTKILWGLITLRDEFYEYTCNGRESIGNIKRKFGIPDHVISRLNDIKDDDFLPEKGRKIYFNYQTED